MKKLLLIDGSNLIFRAYYATENMNIKNPQGIHINAVYGLIKMLNKIINDENPTHIFIALDRSSKTFRHEMYEQYKGARPAIPQKLAEQFPLIYEYFDALGVKKGDREEFEADDLIATYAKHAKQDDYFVKIISGDKDLLQLIDKNVEVLTPKMGFAKECNYTTEVFFEKYEFFPNRFVEYKSLVGDKSDNIIGIDKLGDKTAKKLIKSSTDIDDIINQARDGKIKGKIGENIKENEDLIKRNLKLVTLVEDVELDIHLEQLEFNNKEISSYGEYLKKQGLVKEYSELLKENNLEDKKTELEVKVIEDFSIQEHIKGTSYVYTQNLSENYILSQNLGIGIVNDLGNFYISLDKVNEDFRTFMNGDYPKVFYNLKSLLVNTKILKVNKIKTDLYLALSLINNENYKKQIDQNLISYGIYDIFHFEEVYKAKSNPKMPDIDLVIQDILLKTKALKKTHKHIIKDIKDMNLDDILENIEIKLTKVLAKLELDGIYINQEKLQNLKVKYLEEIKNQENKLLEMTDINFNSFAQLSNLLFDTWNLPKKGIKKTASGYSTDVENLNKLLSLLNESQNEYEKEIEFIKDLLEYRKTTKLLNTYIKNIEKFILKDQKIHPINHQLLAETGRLSVMDPSIQNMPIRTKLGQEIRSIFESQNGTILAFDYSQIELRVIAHFSKDLRLIEAFNKDLDIHEQTAQRIFELDEVTSQKRSQAKAINFGIIYGMSSYGLAKQVGITNFEAQKFIDKYFLEYPKIKEYIDQQIQDAKKTGEVRTLFNRIRKIPNMNSANFKEKETAKRMAINTPIQGTAADIMKMALIKVADVLEKNSLKSNIIMQIHDEIVIDAYEEEKDIIIDLVKQAMENVVSLDVKLKVDFGEGKSWLDAK